jgi:hypothetical protein
LVRQARFIVAPEGSAIFLLFFATAGTRLCVLNHPLVDPLVIYQGLFGNRGIELTILTGPEKGQHHEMPHYADYEIPPDHFYDFLGDWSRRR